MTRTELILDRDSATSKTNLMWTFSCQSSIEPEKKQTFSEPWTQRMTHVHKPFRALTEQDNNDNAPDKKTTMETLVSFIRYRHRSCSPLRYQRNIDRQVNTNNKQRYLN